jgi:hypothetical protein
VGPWQLVPFRLVEEAAVVSETLQRPVDRLIEAYRLPSGGGAVLGAVVIPAGGNTGDSFERSSMPRLAHSLLCGVLGSNPRMALPDEEQEANAGHATCTSENALLYGHPLTDGSSYAIETGVLVRVADLRYSGDDEPLPAVSPPAELPRPLFASFDEDLAHAAHAALNPGDAPGRRLHRALDWYRIAFSNSEAVALDVRVGAARSALEVLADAGDETKRIVRAYGRLVRADDAAEVTYDDVFWAKGPVQLTADEWWLTRLSRLRNEIVHGETVPHDLWHHEGIHQLNQIHDRLIDAMKIVVAERVDDPLLRLPMSDRVFARIARDLYDHLKATDDEPGEPADRE